jgi:diacylglycerol O-acyltransferase / wax synthase
MSALGLAPAPIARSLNRFVQFNSGMFNRTITHVETLRAEGRDDLLV